MRMTYNHDTMHMSSGRRGDITRMVETSPRMVMYIRTIEHSFWGLKGLFS